MQLIEPAETNGFLTTTLRSHPRGAAVARVLAATLRAVDPAVAVQNMLRRDSTGIWVADQVYPLLATRRVVVLAIGKAGAPMLRAASNILGDCVTQTLAVVKEGHSEQLSNNFPTIEAGHPVPDSRSMAAAIQVLGLLDGLDQNDLVLVLISGGGSALLTLPVAGVSLADMQFLTQLLLACGATIGEINTLRKHLEQTKGGGLVQAAGKARVAALVLSDVVGDPLDVIASGPTFPDPSTYADALGILQRYTLLDQIPDSIRAHLRAGNAGQIAETLKPHDPQALHVQHVLVGNNRLAAQAGMAQARQEGLASILLTTSLQGEARVAAGFFAAIMHEAVLSGNPVARPCCLIAGGETTVTLRGNGRGGRNQEFALAMVEPLAELRDALFVALATDGGDGPTDAAGAVVTGETLARARGLGLDVAEYLARNDAYTFFAALGDLLKPGPTRTNVNDLVFGFLL
jgi:glycerate 2-kinase